jgi:hypothetical protein
VTVSDVELDRVLNALTTTFNDQHPAARPTASGVVCPDPARVEQIATGSLGGERKLEARAAEQWRATLHKADDGTKLATLERSPEGKWTAAREQEAQGSHVAVPS